MLQQILFYNKFLLRRMLSYCPKIENSGDFFLLFSWPKVSTGVSMTKTRGSYLLFHLKQHMYIYEKIVTTREFASSQSSIDHTRIS